MDPGSNPNFISFAVEYINGDGDVGSLELLPSTPKTPFSMKQSFGATWDAQLPNGVRGPFSVRLTTPDSKKTVTATNVIPADWAPGKSYRSNVNV